MKQQSSLKTNFIYNMTYQILILIIPLITAPYLSRVIGAEGVGTYSYTYSIVYYFMMLTTLGLNNYGNRTIAKSRDDKKIMSKNFWSIYLFQLFMGIVMIFCYFVYINVFDSQYKLYFIIEILYIVSAILDISWFFFGIEAFKKVIIRNTLIKVINLILIFTLVKSSNDLWKYVLIMSGMTCAGQLVFWFSLKNKVMLVKVTLQDITKHIKPNLILFIPVIAVSLYKMMDKIMLGSLANVTEVGFYENAEKIEKIPNTIITALGTVMLPRMSNMAEKGEEDKAQSYINKSMNFVMFLSLAMCFGLIGIAYHFAPMYFGDEFQKTGILIMLLAITLPIMAFANVIRTQYLIPTEKDNVYIISVSLGAITNLIINFLLIPKFQSVGACIGTIAAEFAVMFYQAFIVRKELKIYKYIKEGIPFLIRALVMFICIIPFNFISMNAVIRLGLQIILGVLIYFLLNWRYINSLVDIKDLLRRILNKTTHTLKKKKTINKD